MLSLAELVQLLPPPAPVTPALLTGLPALDHVLLGGGLPRGRLTEIIGQPGGGKTTLARTLVETTVATHGWVAYIDAERTLDPRDWIHLGNTEGLWIIRPTDPGRAAWSADILLRSGAFALVVLDGAPMLSRSAAVRLTGLARESNAAFVVLGDRTGGASQLGGAVRLLVERRAPPVPRPALVLRRSTSPPRVPGDQGASAVRTIGVRIEKGGINRTVEVSCAIPVARRLCSHPEVPDRRGVARGPAGGSRHARAGRPAPAPAAGVDRRPHPQRATALG